MKKREDRRQEEKGDGKERRRGGWTRVVIPSSPLASLLTLYNPAQVAHSPADPKEKGGERGFKGGQDASPALSAVTASWLHPFHPPQGGRCGHRKGGQPRNSCHPASDKRSQPVPRIISLLPLSPRLGQFITLTTFQFDFSSEFASWQAVEFGSGVGGRGIWGRAGLF